MVAQTEVTHSRNRPTGDIHFPKIVGVCWNADGQSHLFFAIGGL